MITLLLALGLGQVPGTATAEAQATLQSCDMTPAGWVCNYRMPAVILRGVPPESVIMTDPPAIMVPVPPTVSPSVPPPEITTAEADRQARLIARCADASWLSLCLPGDRREAKILQEAAIVRAALRAEVTQLLSEGQCDEAVRVALAGADMTLAWEARNFCAARPATADAAAVPN
ncbi:MAG: hypothetical protein ACOH1E_09465 [Brevundimonas sp.]